MHTNLDKILNFPPPLYVTWLVSSHFQSYNGGETFALQETSNKAETSYHLQFYIHSYDNFIHLCIYILYTSKIH